MESRTTSLGGGPVGDYPHCRRPPPNAPPHPDAAEATSSQIQRSHARRRIRSRSGAWTGRYAWGSHLGPMHEGRAGGDCHRWLRSIGSPLRLCSGGCLPAWPRASEERSRIRLGDRCRFLAVVCGRALIFREQASQREGSSLPSPPLPMKWDRPGGGGSCGRCSNEFEIHTDAVRNWSELPLDMLSSVFAKVGAVDVLMGAGLVCRSWLEAAKVPKVWRSVDMEHHEILRGKKKKNQDVLCAMAKAAVDRSNGWLEVFMGSQFVTDELLKYISERSSSLKSLSLDYCNISNEAFTELIIKSPLLEELLISHCPFVGGDIYMVMGRVCTQLKRLMLRHGPYGDRDGVTGIEMMHELRYLTLVDSDITTDELVAVVDSCSHLERLCIRNCRNIVVDGALRAKCSRIKTLVLPSLQNMLYRFLFHPDDGLFTDKFDDWRSS